MKFTKLHGIGNDYIFIDAEAEHVSDPAALAKEMSNRHLGVGSDGIILVEKPAPGVNADFKMRMFNADGFEGEMCGNGIRCLAKFVRDRSMTAKDKLVIETNAGLMTVKVFLERGKVSAVAVDMGVPSFLKKDVGIDGKGEAEDAQLEINGRVITFSFASMGNPHAIAFVENPDKYPLSEDGPAVENHPMFRNRINAHFAAIISRSEVRMTTWERGSGITLACGTGASAVVAAGVKKGLLDGEVLVHLPGGDLEITWPGPGEHLYMRGPAEEVFSGEWPD